MRRAFITAKHRRILPPERSGPFHHGLIPKMHRMFGPAEGEIVRVPACGVDQSFVRLGDLAKFFRGGTRPPIRMESEGEYPIGAADRLFVRISRNAENSIEIHSQGPVVALLVAAAAGWLSIHIMLGASVREVTFGFGVASP